MTESYSFVKIALLPNGFHKRTRNSTFVQNTTVFDAPFHMIFCFMADDEKLKEQKLSEIRGICGNISLFIESYFKKGVLQDTLIKRTYALELKFNTEVVDGMRTMNCESGDIKSVIEFYITSIFPTAKLNAICTNHETRKDISFFDIDDDCWELLKNCQNIDFSKDVFCSECGGQAKITFVLNNFLFFVTDRKEKWQDIPKVAIVQGLHYKLSAMIERVHNYYIAHVMRPNKKWYTFDHTENAVKPSHFYHDMNINLLCFSKNSFCDEYTYHHVLANSHTVLYNGERIRVQHGCAPNSVLHCLSSLYIDSPNLFEKKSSDLLSFLTTFARDHQKPAILNDDARYVARYKILEPHFEKKPSDNEFYIDCFTNIRGILDLLIQNDFHSLITWCSCSPTNQQSYTVLDIDYNAFSLLDFNSIDQCINFPKRSCVTCKQEVTNMLLGNIICVDVQPLQLPAEGIDVPAKEILIHDIPQTIELNKSQYALKGVIEYKTPNHYIAHCLRSNQKWYKIDDVPRTIVESRSTLVPQILIYTRNV